MKAVVVYESMFGNTRQVAEAIAQGIRSSMDVELLRIDEVGDGPLRANVLVVGGPTHGHTMSTLESRAAAADWEGDGHRGLTVEGSPVMRGIREWLAARPQLPPLFAAFDTRVDVPRLLSGRASAHIAREVRQLGPRETIEPASFLVSRHTVLEPGERGRAKEWGVRVAHAASESTERLNQ